MVDWATQNRLFPPGYHPVDIRYRRKSLDKSLPHSFTRTKRHQCGKQIESKTLDEDKFFSSRQTLDKVVNFHESLTIPDSSLKAPNLLASYTPKIEWPRSVCCFTETDGSLVVCLEQKCLLILFTSQLMIRSTCGGIRGNGNYEFDSPWSVVSLYERECSSLIVADTNNRRLQHFVVSPNGNFLYRNSLPLNEKPFYLTSSEQYFAASCEQATIICYSQKEKSFRSKIDLNKSRLLKKRTNEPLAICFDVESSFLFVNDSTSSIGRILQLTVGGEFLRMVSLEARPFIRVTSLIFDRIDQQLIIGDASNSLICSVDQDLDDGHLEIILKSTDQLNFPQSMCLTNEGHLVVVECSVMTEHSLKIFRHHSCLCHTRLSSSSLKTSETTAVRSLFFSH